MGQQQVESPCNKRSDWSYLEQSDEDTILFERMRDCISASLLGKGLRLWVRFRRLSQEVFQTAAKILINHGVRRGRQGLLVLAIQRQIASHSNTCLRKLKTRLFQVCLSCQTIS